MIQQVHRFGICRSDCMQHEQSHYMFKTPSKQGKRSRIVCSAGCIKSVGTKDWAITLILVCKMCCMHSATVWLYACLLSINAINTMRQAQLFEHEVATRLKQFAYDAVWLLQVSLNEQNTPASLQQSNK